MLTVDTLSIRRLSTARLYQSICACDALLDQIFRADDPIAPIHKKLVDQLAKEWEGRIPNASAAAERVVAAAKPDELFSMQDLEDALVAAGEPLIEGWTKATEKPVTVGIEAGYGVGRDGTLKPTQIAVDLNLTDEHAKKMLASDTHFWVGNAWSNELSAQIAGVIEREVIDKGLSRRDAGAELHRIFGEVFPDRSRRYWDIVAAAGVVRARTFGTVESFVQAEVVEYEYLNPMDDRTTPVCFHLHGKVFRVQAAVEQRDRWLAAESPEEAKAAHPWVKAADVEGKSAEELEQAGIVQPPLHADCRSTLVASRFAGE